MTDLRFAVFGAGFWAPFQMAGWSEVGGARCVAIYNQTADRAEKLARSFCIPAVYADPEELLDREKLDFVDIVTDVLTHSRFVQMVAERGIPVICQKPMAHCLEEAERVVTFCRDNRVPFYIHENWRWQGQIRALKKVLDSGEIGRPFRARIFLVSGYPLFRYEPNLRDLEQFVLADMGTHILDVVRFLFGEADRVYCQTHQVQKGIRGEDVATVMLHMESGTSVTCYMGFPGHFLEHDVFTQTLMLVEGERGSVELDRDYWIRVTTKSGTRSNRHAPVWRPWMNPQYLPSQASISACIADLLAGLRGDKEPETTAEDNLKTIRLTFAAYESARSRQVVELSRFKKIAEPIARLS
jgi:D-apiose dehydrogenase